MLKVVLDINIFISFLISHQPPISTIFDMWSRGELAIYYSPEILEELEMALKYPRIRELISNSESEALVNAVKVMGILVTPERKLDVCRDKKDDKYLEASLASSSKFLVTGDKDLLALKKFEDISILSPRDFAQTIGI